MSDPARLNLSAGLASVAVALVLVGLKLWALQATGALSVAASLADSALDLMVSGAGLAAILYAAKPADDDHAFGHSSAEDLTALGQALFICGAALGIAVLAVLRLSAPDAGALGNERQGIWVMGLAIVLTLALLAWQRRVVRRTGNKVVAADSLHYVGDLIPNLGAIVALAASDWLGVQRLDSIVALGAAAVMLGGALHIGRRAWDALMDRAADPVLVADIARIAGSFPGVQGWHGLRTRSSGSRVFVNLHVELDGSQSLNEAHAITAALRRALLKAHPGIDVIIHQDPVGVRPHPEDPSKQGQGAAQGVTNSARR